MADFVMCSNVRCPLADSCYRRTATPKQVNQEFSFFEPYSNTAQVVCVNYVAFSAEKEVVHA